MVTDPPYGVGYDKSWRRVLRQEKNRQYKTEHKQVANDHIVDWSAAYQLFKGDVAYVWHAGAKGREVAASLEASGFIIRTQLIWVKEHFAISRGHYHPKHEACYYAVRKGGTGHWQGSRKETTVWNITRKHEIKTGHPTQKPLHCMTLPIKNNSAEGDAVYDPFLGSGTTLIAADQLGRVCYGIELMPAVVDMAIQRWQVATGQQAVCANDGMTFNERLASIA